MILLLLIFMILFGDIKEEKTPIDIDSVRVVHIHVKACPKCHGVGIWTKDKFYLLSTNNIGHFKEGDAHVIKTTERVSDGQSCIVSGKPAIRICRPVYRDEVKWFMQQGTIRVGIIYQQDN